MTLTCFDVTSSINSCYDTLRHSELKSEALRRESAHTNLTLIFHPIRKGVTNKIKSLSYIYVPITLDECHAWFHLYELGRDARNTKQRNLVQNAIRTHSCDLETDHPLYNRKEFFKNQFYTRPIHVCRSSSVSSDMYCTLLTFRKI